MNIAPGYTNDEVRNIVHTYERQPHGQKMRWLATQGITRDRFRRWRATVFDGDLDRGLVPRESSLMTPAPHRRALAHAQDHTSRENEQLRARVRELEQANAALGKAIGLLHQLNEQEPDTRPTSEPKNS